MKIHHIEWLLNRYPYRVIVSLIIDCALLPSISPTDKTIVQVMQDNYNGGPDFTFECVGNIHLMRAALESAHKGKHAWLVCIFNYKLPKLLNIHSMN